jgi:hypothetical protein
MDMQGKTKPDYTLLTLAVKLRILQGGWLCLNWHSVRRGIPASQQKNNPPMLGPIITEMAGNLWVLHASAPVYSQPSL